MPVSEAALDRAWDMWNGVWAKGAEREKGAYRFALSDLTDDQFREAARLAMAECRFWPTPYDIKRLAPPPAKSFARNSTQPEGYKPPDSLTDAELLKHRRLCERWFHAVTQVPIVDPETNDVIQEQAPQAGAWNDLLRRVIATQYLLAKGELAQRESCKEEQRDPESDPARDQRLQNTDGGILEQLREAAEGSVGLRRDSSGERTDGALPDDHAGTGISTQEQDDPDPRTVGVPARTDRGGDSRLGSSEVQKQADGQGCAGGQSEGGVA